MRGGIFQIRRDAYPAGAVGDNVAEGLGYAAGGDWEPAASAPDANGLGDAHVDVSQVAENLRISRPSAYKAHRGGANSRHQDREASSMFGRTG